MLIVNLSLIGNLGVLDSLLYSAFSSLKYNFSYYDILPTYLSFEHPTNNTTYNIIIANLFIYLNGPYI